MVAGLTASNDWTGTGTGKATVVVRAGDAGRTIGVALQKAGVVKTSKAFADVAADNPQAGSIQPGTYALRTRMSAAVGAGHAARPGQPHRAPGDRPRGAVEDRGDQGAVQGHRPAAGRVPGGR